MKAMTHRLVDTSWASELVDSLRFDRSELQIVCPFIKALALDELLALKSARIRVVTRYNLSNFTDGASGIAALRKLHIRVHHAEFIADTMANGVSPNELMHVLKADSFASTQENAARSEATLTPAMHTCSNPRSGFQQMGARG